MPDEPKDDDRKVKDVIDAVTQAELERWFGLPSFAQVEDRVANATPEEVEVDLEMQAVIERRRKATEAVDPALLASLVIREDEPERGFVFKYTIESRIPEKFGVVDEVLVARVGAPAEPREVQIPDELREDMKDVTPQALLRDLHRNEEYFDKLFEVVDLAVELRFDVSNEVRSAMATRWTVPPLEASPRVESENIVAQGRIDLRNPWTDLIPHMKNRVVRE
jgi:hypothetical protein